MKKFKIYIVAVLMIIFTAFPSAAFVPVAIPAWMLATSVVVAASAAASGMYYAMNANGVRTVYPDGSVTRSVTVAAVMSAANSLNLFTSDINAKISYDSLMMLSEKLFSDGSKVYPSLFDATHGPFLAPPVSEDSTAGTIVSVNGVNMRFLGWGVYNQYQDFVASAGTIINYGAYFTLYGSWQGGVWSTGHNFRAEPVDTPLSPLPPDSASKKIAGGSLPVTAGSPIPSISLGSEIDRMLQDPDYVPVFTDGSDPLATFNIPSGVLTPEQTKAANDAAAAAAAVAASSAAVKSAAQAAADAAKAAATQARATAEQAKTTATQTATTAAANPTDVEAQKRAAEAAAAATIAEANARAAELEQAKTDADLAKVEEMIANEKPSDFKKFSWEKFKSLKNILGSTFPFTLISTLVGYVSLLLASPVAPAFDLPIWGGNVIHISLAVFDPVAAVSRWMFSILLSIGAVQMIVAFWRGN